MKVYIKASMTYYEIVKYEDDDEAVVDYVDTEYEADIRRRELQSAFPYAEIAIRRVTE